MKYVQDVDYAGIKYTLAELNEKFEKSATTGGYSLERTADADGSEGAERIQYVNTALQNAWETAKLINKKFEE